MKYSRVLLCLCVAGLSLAPELAQATDEDAFLGNIQPPSGQTVGHGRSALWTLPLVATQYQPSQPTPAMQAAMQAQQEGRFLDALIQLDDAAKSAKPGTGTAAEIDLLRASFLLQGNQSRQAQERLSPLRAQAQYAADAYALTAMAHLQQGQMQEALDAAQHAQSSGSGILPPLALSYALQGMGRLTEAQETMHRFNTSASRSAITLAREAELALTLDQVQSARTLANQAHQVDAAHPYVVAVNGLVYLIDENAREAKAAFEIALQRDPKDAGALLGLGLAEIKLGNFQAGQGRLQAANEADPGNALILTYLGRAQQQLGQTEAARASWHSAQQADPKDPVPWLYQAQAELQANHPMDARESLREAQARAANRSVYRGERLLKEDEQLLQANLAEVQRQLGMESLAYHSLTDISGEKNSANLRNQADLLQGLRFGESARRSLLLQSQFNERPGNLPAELDVYGDGAGQTGATTPQHGVVSGLSATQASYNNYDELFSRRAALEADAISGNQNTMGHQVRLGAGSETLGLGIAHRQFVTDGNAPFENLDNQIWQGTVQWRPLKTTQMFLSHQTFNSQHGEMLFPGDPGFLATPTAITDNSQVTRLGLRQNLTDHSELRALWSHQQTDQTVNYLDFFSGAPLGTNSSSSNMHGAELQFRTNGANHATQWGVQQTRGQVIVPGFSDYSKISQQFYAAWQQTLSARWQVDAGLGWGKMEVRDNTGGGNSPYLKRWLPKLGVVYTPDRITHLRFAAWQGMGFVQAGDAALAPVSLAGVLLSRPDDNGQLVHGVALGGDRQLGAAWLLDGKVQQRRTDEPSMSGSSGQILLRRQVDESRLALHWKPQGQPVAVSLAYDHERIQNAPMSMFLETNSVQEQSLRSQQLAMRWFASEQWTANLALSHNQVAGTLQTMFGTTSLAYQDSFTQADADVSWKFNRSGSMNVGVRNAADKRFQYTNIDPLNPRFSNGRLIYAKLKLAW